MIAACISQAKRFQAATRFVANIGKKRLATVCARHIDSARDGKIAKKSHQIATHRTTRPIRGKAAGVDSLSAKAFASGPAGLNFRVERVAWAF
jgi:hypothetical protein